MPEVTENVANFAIWCLWNSLDENTVFLLYQSLKLIWLYGRFSTVVATLLEIRLLSASYSKEC